MYNFIYKISIILFFIYLNWHHFLYRMRNAIGMWFLFSNDMSFSIAINLPTALWYHSALDVPTCIQAVAWEKTAILQIVQASNGIFQKLKYQKNIGTQNLIIYIHRLMNLHHTLEINTNVILTYRNNKMVRLLLLSLVEHLLWHVVWFPLIELINWHNLFNYNEFYGYQDTVMRRHHESSRRCNSRLNWVAFSWHNIPNVIIRVWRKVVLNLSW